MSSSASSARRFIARCWFACASIAASVGAAAAQGVFLPTDDLNQKRSTAAAVVLADDRVLITGGIDRQTSSTALTAAEIFDPSTSMWTVTATSTGTTTPLGRPGCVG